MASFHYDMSGKLLGFTKTSADIARDNKIIGLLVIVAIVIAPFAPVFLLSYNIFLRLHEVYGIHALFSGAIAVASAFCSLYYLWKSRVIRYIYFGFETIFVALVVFGLIVEKSDAIWATFFAGLALAVGTLLTFILANLGFDNNDEAAYTLKKARRSH